MILTAKILGSMALVFMATWLVMAAIHAVKCRKRDGIKDVWRRPICGKPTSKECG